MIYTVTAVIPTNNSGWHGVQQVPSFAVEAGTVWEAVAKAAEILTLAGGKATVMVCANDSGDCHGFVAEGGEVVNLHSVPLV